MMEPKSNPSPARPYEMMAMPADEFAILRAALPVATAIGLYDTYRISQSTWYKLRDGVPVKKKTLDQLRRRFAEVQLQNSAAL